MQHPIFIGILGVNLALSSLLFYSVARIYILPNLVKRSPKQFMTPVLLLHGLRHLGLMFLVQGVILPGMPMQFSFPTAIGDLISAVLAMTALYFIYRNSNLSKTMVWIFNIFGTLDFLLAIILSIVFKASNFMGGSYRIPSFWVPILLVLHYTVFVYLIKYRKNKTVIS